MTSKTKKIFCQYMWLDCMSRDQEKVLHSPHWLSIFHSFPKKSKSIEFLLVSNRLPGQEPFFLWIMSFTLHWMKNKQVRLWHSFITSYSWKRYVSNPSLALITSMKQQNKLKEKLFLTKIKYAASQWPSQIFDKILHVLQAAWVSEGLFVQHSV